MWVHFTLQVIQYIPMSTLTAISTDWKRFMINNGKKKHRAYNTTEQTNSPAGD